MKPILAAILPFVNSSLSAKAIAAKWQMPLYLLDFATVQGRYVGQSEQQLKEALEKTDKKKTHNGRNAIVRFGPGDRIRTCGI